MSLFPSTLTGRVLDDGQTPPPVIELQGISAGQLSLVLTQYTPLETTTQNTADIGTNAAAIAALQGQVAALPAAPDLTPYALAADLAAAEGSILANASGLVAVNTSLTQGLATKANQSALDALQVEVNGKSTPASVDLKLANHPTTAAMNSSIASANNATLSSVAATYALKTVVDQLAIDLAARQTAADVDQRVATALLSYLTQTAYQAGQALQDARLDGHDAEILALQNAGPFATAGDLSNLQVTLQSAIDGILAEIATLGGATNLVNAPAWLGNVTWDLLAGTNQIRNLHATGPLSIQLANDDWTLSFGCDAYTTQQTDDAIAAALTNYFTRAEVTATIVAAIDESKGYTDTQLTDYSTTAQMTQAITDALVPFETAAQRDAAIAAALAAYYTSAQTDAVIAAAIAPYYTSAQTDAAIAAAVALSNGQSWTGGATFNLLRGSNVLRNLSVAGALTATFQNLDDTILIESDSYARSETYTQAETGAAITAAIDALNLSQYRTEAQVQALIAGEPWCPTGTRRKSRPTWRASSANYATSSSVTSAISSALSSYDDSSQVDSKIITALLDFYTRAEPVRFSHCRRRAWGSSVDLSKYYTQAETQSYVANELDHGVVTLGPNWTPSSRPRSPSTGPARGPSAWRSTTPSPARASSTQALADQYWVLRGQRQRKLRVPGAHQRDSPNDQGPPAPGAPGVPPPSSRTPRSSSPATPTAKAESDGRYLSSSNFAPLDARFFVRNPAVAEGNGLFHLVQEQFTPRFIRSLLFRPPLTGRGILGNFSVIEIEVDSWSKAQSDSRYPLVATFNSLGSTVTSIDGRVTALENAPGVAPTADLTVNSLTATSFVQTPLLQSAAADLQIRNATTTIRAEDGTLLASFAAGSIGLEQDITVRSDRTLNATTADFAQFFVGSTAATGAFTSSSSITCTQQIESDLRVQAPLLRCDPAASVLTVTGGTQGVLVDDTLRVNGAIAPEASLPFLSLKGAAAACRC